MGNIPEALHVACSLLLSLAACEEGHCTVGAQDLTWKDASTSETKELLSDQAFFSRQIGALHASFGLGSSCSVTQAAQAFVATLQDAQGQKTPVDMQISGVPYGDQVAGDAAFSFTPPHPGSYRLDVTSEPSQTSTITLTVFQSMPTERTPLQTFSKYYKKIQETANQTWLCDGDVIREGTSIQTLSGYTSVYQNVVWQADRGNLTRYIDLGSGSLMPTASVPMAPSIATTFRMLPTDVDIVVVSTTINASPDLDATRYVYDGANLAPAGSLAVHNGNAGEILPADQSGNVVEIVRVDKQIYFAHSRFLDDGTRATSVCTAQIVEPNMLSPAPGPCQQFPAALLGADEQAIWLTRPSDNYFTSSPSTLIELLPSAGMVLQAGSIELPSTCAVKTDAGRPWVVAKGSASPQLVPRMADGNLILEEYVTSAFPLTGATAPFRIAQNPNFGQTLVFPE
jgi:hypothetical protein